MTISISHANAHRYVITIIDNDTWLSLARIAAVRASHLGSSQNRNMHRYFVRVSNFYVCTKLSMFISLHVRIAEFANVNA